MKTKTHISEDVTVFIFFARNRKTTLILFYMGEQNLLPASEIETSFSSSKVMKPVFTTLCDFMSTFTSYPIKVMKLDFVTMCHYIGTFIEKLTDLIFGKVLK